MTTVANSNDLGRASASGSTTKEFRLPILKARTRPCDDGRYNRFPSFG